MVNLLSHVPLSAVKTCEIAASNYVDNGKTRQELALRIANFLITEGAIEIVDYGPRDKLFRLRVVSPSHFKAKEMKG